MGIFFTYLAFLQAGETVWNILTIILLLIATFDFVVGFHYLRRKKPEEKEQ